MEEQKPKPPRPVTQREVKKSGLGDMLFHTSKPSDMDSVEVVPGFRIHVMFGNIFVPRKSVLKGARGWVPVMPFFATSTIYQQWTILGGSTGISGQPGVLRSVNNGNIVFVQAHPGDECPLAQASEAPQAAEPQAAQEENDDELDFSEIELGVLYRYDRTLHKLDQDFSAMAACLPEGSTLAFPAIGINNGMTYYQSAYRMFYSVISCLKLDNNPMRKMSGVVFMAPFVPASVQSKSSVRTMQHLFNMLKTLRYTEREEDCTICDLIKPDSIMPCGHRFCQRCVVDVMDSGKCECPICRAKFDHFYPCEKPIDCTDIECCKAMHEPTAKVKMIFAPCGHHSVYCDACYGEKVRSGVCPICDEPFYAPLPFFY